MGEHVEEEHLIERPVGERERVQIGDLRAHVGMAGQPDARGVDQRLADVDAGDAAGPRRQQLRGGAVARARVEDVAEIAQADEAARQRLPGAARRVVAFHLARNAVGPAAVAPRLGGACAQHRRAAATVGRHLRVFEIGRHHRPELAGGGGQVAVRHPVISRAARSPIAHQARLPQLAEVGRHPRLPELGHRAQLVHGQLVVAEQREQAHARRLREQREQVGGGVQG